ncbi:hypothetical protein HYZ99_00590 [Candidatus Peregrinibacteria bacterium]|nr:hypothetical protein [Candidatus Peregrinibacteria bacterium]
MVKRIDVHELKEDLSSKTGIVDLKLQDIRSLIAAAEAIPENSSFTAGKVNEVFFRSGSSGISEEERQKIADVMNLRLNEIRESVVEAGIHPRLLQEMARTSLDHNGLITNYRGAVTDVTRNIQSYLDPTRPVPLRVLLEKNLRQKLLEVPSYSDYCRDDIANEARQIERMHKDKISEPDIESAVSFLLEKVDPILISELNEIVSNLHQLASEDALDKGKLLSELTRLYKTLYGEEYMGRPIETYMRGQTSTKNIERIQTLNEEFCGETPQEYDGLIADATFTTHSQTGFSEAAQFWHDYGKDSKTYKFMHPLVEGKTFIDLGCSHSDQPRLASKALGASRYIGVDRYRHDEDGPPTSMCLEEMVCDCKAKNYFLRNNIGRTNLEEERGSDSIWIEDDMLGFISKIEKQGGYTIYISGVEREDDMQQNKKYYARIAEEYLAALWKEVARITAKGDTVIVGNAYSMNEEVLEKYGFKALFPKKHSYSDHSDPLSSISGSYQIYQKE